jgi:uncharacterized metal-binding protein
MIIITIIIMITTMIIIIMIIMIIITAMMKHMRMPVKLNRFTHPRALSVLHNRGMLAHVTRSVAGHYSSN